MPSPVPQSAELVGYAAAMDRSFPASSPIVTLDELAALNAVVLGKPGNPPPPSVLRETPLHLEVFDDEGRAMGRVLQTLPPRLLQDKIEDPYAAVVGAYLLLRLKRFSQMHDWGQHLADWFPFLPDGCVLWASQLMQQPSSDPADSSKTIRPDCSVSA
jgi:hypothetical protein